MHPLRPTRHPSTAFCPFPFHHLTHACARLRSAQVGGRCQSVHLSAPLPPIHNTSSPANQPSEGSFRFDTGPSLLLFPETYRQAYRRLGHELSDHLDLYRVEPAAYRIFFEGKGHLDMLYDVQRMMQQLEGVEPGAGACASFFASRG